MKKLMACISFCALFATTIPITESTAQVITHDGCQQYALVPSTVMRPNTVTTYKYVEETKYETEKVTRYKPVWKTEKRERKTTSYKPVRRTKFREEKQIVYKPVVERSFREETVEETVYETVTEMREQKRYVQKPMIERSFREERVVVRKPVTETRMETENVTVYRPVTETRTAYMPSVATVNQLAYQPGRVRNRLQFLRPGYYPDPAGQMTYKTGGFYWVPQQNAGSYQMQSTTVPTVTAQQFQQTTMRPEIVTRQKPVQVTRYVDTIETRKVPIETQTTRTEVVVEKVPVEVQVPKVRRTTRKVPIEKVTYVAQEVVKRIPYTEIEYETVETIEPYEVQVKQMVAETSERVVPRRVLRRIPVESTGMVPVTTYRRVPLDPWGNPIVSTTVEVVRDARPIDETIVREIPGSFEVVESTSTQPQSVVIRDSLKPVVEDDANLREVEKPNTGNGKTEPEKTERQESKKQPIPAETKNDADNDADNDANGGGNDKVDVKKSETGAIEKKPNGAEQKPSKLDGLNGPNNKTKKNDG